MGGLSRRGLPTERWEPAQLGVTCEPIAPKLILRSRILLILAALASCVLLPPSVVAGQSACLPAAPRSNVLIGELKELMTTTDPEEISERDTLLKVPVVNPDDVTLVTDEAICTKVIAAYAAPRPARVLAIRLGRRGYAALDPVGLAGEFENVLIFDRRFKRIGGWTA